MGKLFTPTVADDVVEHPFASVIVTVRVPAVVARMDCVV